MISTPPEPTQDRRRGRVWRLTRAALVAFLSLYALYVAGINAFLSSSAFDTYVNFDREMLDIHFRKGWSVFPGRIHARDLSIRSSDSNVEWILRADEVDFDMSFVALASRRFEVSRVRGRGVSMRARQKLDAWPDSNEAFAYLPPIDGFPAFSVRPALPHGPARWDDAHYKLFTVSLEDVVAEDVREVWVDGGRFEGHAMIAGRFYLKPIRAVEVGPARIEIHTGRVTVGPSLMIAKDVVGSADVTVARFDPRYVDGNDVLRHFSVATELRAVFADPSTLPFALPGDLHVSTEVSARRLALQLKRGVLATGTRIELGSAHASVAKKSVIGTGAFDFIGEVVRDAGRDRLRGNLAMIDLSLVRSDAQPIGHAPRVTVAVDACELDLAAKEPLRDAHVVIEVPDAELPDASVLNAYIAEETPVAIIDGYARANGRVEVWPAERRAAGRGDLQADPMNVRLAKMRARGKFAVTASFGSLRWEEALLEDATLDIHLVHATLGSERTPNAPKVAADSVVLAARSRRIDLGDPLAALEVSFAMPEASIVDLDLLTVYLPSPKMKLIQGKTAFGIDGQITIEDHLGRGELHAQSPGLGLALGDLRFRAELKARAKVHNWRWEHGDLALDDAAVEVSALETTRGTNLITLGSVGRVRATATSPAFSFSDPLARLELQAQLGDVKIADPRIVDAFLPDGATYGFASDNGVLAADIQLSIRRHVAKGRASLCTRGMGVRTSAVTLWGDTDVALDLSRWDMTTSRMVLAPSRLAITNVRGLFGAARQRELTAKSVELMGTAAALDLARPTLAGVDARLVLEDAALPDARALQVVLPPGPLEIKSGSVRASADVSVSSSGQTASGIVALDITNGGVVLGSTTLAGNFALRGELLGFDPETSTFDLSGSRLEMRGVEVTNAVATKRGWRGDVRIEDAKLQLADAPSLDGIVRLEADDAEPVLGVLLRDSLPRFIAGFLEMPNLAGRAHLHFAPNVLLLSELYLRGGDIAARGAYGIYDEERRGAFIVSKGPLAIGVRVDNEGSHARFFGLDGWFATQERVVLEPARIAREQKRGAAPRKAKADGRRAP